MSPVRPCVYFVGHVGTYGLGEFFSIQYLCHGSVEDLCKGREQSERLSYETWVRREMAWIRRNAKSAAEAGVGMIQACSLA